MEEYRTLVLLGIDTQQPTTASDVAEYTSQVTRMVGETKIPKEDDTKDPVVFVIFNSGFPTELSKLIIENYSSGTDMTFNFLLQDEGQEVDLITRINEFFSTKDNIGSVLVAILDKKDLGLAGLKLHIKESRIRASQVIQIYTLHGEKA